MQKNLYFSFFLNTINTNTYNLHILETVGNFKLINRYQGYPIVGLYLNTPVLLRCFFQSETYGRFKSICKIQ